LFFIFLVSCVFACVLFRRVLSCFRSEKGLGSFLFHFFVLCVFCVFLDSTVPFVCVAVSLFFVFFAPGLVCSVCVFVSLRVRCLSVLASRALRASISVVGLRVFPPVLYMFSAVLASSVYLGFHLIVHSCSVWFRCPFPCLRSSSFLRFLIVAVLLPFLVSVMCFHIEASFLGGFVLVPF